MARPASEGLARTPPPSGDPGEAGPRGRLGPVNLQGDLTVPEGPGAGECRTGAGGKESETAARPTPPGGALDDGDTWKEINLSESAVESSFTLDNGAGAPYPGDVTDIVHAVAGNKILVAWASKYCDQGSPRYSLKDINGDGIPDDHASEDPDAVPIYPDPFGVAGSQRSIDYTEWMHHGQYPFAHVGEVPFSCVWTARGTVEQVTSPQTGLPQWGVRWRKAERLTSGRRDAFKLTIDGVEGAGFVIAWQEDPEGLRPGYGEGPGVGWSGATVNHKADIWYSFIGWNEFDLVENPLTPGIPATDPDLLDTNKPQVFERMSMPVRMTDNDKCEMEVDAFGNAAGRGRSHAEHAGDREPRAGPPLRRRGGRLPAAPPQRPRGRPGGR